MRFCLKRLTVGPMKNQDEIDRQMIREALAVPTEQERMERARELRISEAAGESERIQVQQAEREALQARLLQDFLNGWTKGQTTCRT
jgi:hypothetical protein